MRRLLSRVFVTRVLVAAVFSAAVFVPPVAHAQPAAAEPEPPKQPASGELAAARQWFIDALALEKENDWAAALEKFEKVGSIKMTPQVRFHIALCHENLGRLVDAINGFELAAQEATRAGDKARNVAENAPVRAAALRGRVGHVTLTLSGRLTISEIWLDNSRVSDALFGSKIPVDPGEHTVQVRRGEQVIWQETLTVAAAESEALEVEVDDPEVAPPPDPNPGGGGVGGGDARGGEDESKRIPAYIVGGVGVASLATAGVMWGLRESTLSAVAASCEDPATFDGCDPNDKDNFALALRYDIASKVTLGVGAAALATGVVLFFVLAPDDGAESAADEEEAVEPQPSVTIFPLATPQYGGIGIWGTF